MSLAINKKRFSELVALAKTEEQKAVLVARMIYGNGYQALHDTLEDLEEMEDEDANCCINDGIEYLETLVEVKMNKEDLN
jgi:hypothetical protein